MKDVEQLVRTGIQNALKESFQIDADPEQLQLQETKKEFEGSVTFTTFAYSKLTKKSPEETFSKKPP